MARSICNNLQFVVSSDGSEPWGIGFANSLVNSKTKSAIAKLRSPADGFTWIFNWYADLKIWASFKIPGDKGFCTLSDLLESEDTMNLWNNKGLVASWTFVKDKVDGEQITEALAIEMADLFPSEPSSEPVTPIAGNKRRLFEASPAGSSSKTSESRTEGQWEPPRAWGRVGRFGLCEKML